MGFPMSEHDLLFRVIQVRAGGRVRRCHNVLTTGVYSVAEHSWGAAMLFHALWPDEFPSMALAVLTHDVAEAVVGDIPSPTIRYTNTRELLEGIEERVNERYGVADLSNLTGDQYDKLKAVDRLELYLWAIEQRLQGNQFAREVEEEIAFYLSMSELPAPADRLFKMLTLKAGVPPKHELLPIGAGAMFRQVMED